MSTVPTLQIPRDVIEPIIQAQISKAIIEALGNGEQILQQAIASILSMQVDADGKPASSSYSHSNHKKWIDWAVGDSLRKAARAAIEEALTKHSEVLKKNIASQLSSRNSPLMKQLAEQLVLGVSNAESLKYRLTVSCESR